MRGGRAGTWLCEFLDSCAPRLWCRGISRSLSLLFERAPHTKNSRLQRPATGRSRGWGRCLSNRMPEYRWGQERQFSRGGPNREAFGCCFSTGPSQATQSLPDALRQPAVVWAPTRPGRSGRFSATDRRQSPRTRQPLSITVIDHGGDSFSAPFGVDRTDGGRTAVFGPAPY